MNNMIDIDLGTTNSCVAVMENGQPRVTVRKVELLIIEVDAALDAANFTLDESRTDAPARSRRRLAETSRQRGAGARRCPRRGRSGRRSSRM